jgi:hypothetical protein
MQHHIGDARRGLCHEDGSLRFAPREERQRADVVLMGVRNDNGIDASFGNGSEIRGGDEALSLGMHSAIENNRLPLCPEKVGIRPDFHIPRQIPKLHSTYAMQKDYVRERKMHLLRKRVAGRELPGRTMTRAIGVASNEAAFASES